MKDPIILSLERLEARELPSAALVQVAPADLFAGSTADNVASQPGVNYASTQNQTILAVNPTHANNIVGAWQQDRWDNAGSRGIEIAVSNDGGHSWSAKALPGVSQASGGQLARATDSWLSFAPNGDLYSSTLSWNPAPLNDPTHPYPFDETRSAILVNKSTDGGSTWSAPTALIDDASPNLNSAGHPELVFNDKDTITADPTNSNRAYAVWTRITYDLATGEFRGPTYYSDTTDGGKTWSTAHAIYDPGASAQTIGNQIVVLPNGTLINVFAQGTETSRQGDYAVIRSTDHGKTWSAPVIIDTGVAVSISDPETGVRIRSGDTMPCIAVDPHSSAVYVVTQGLDLKDGTALPGVVFAMSTDGGLTWSKPIAINKTPAGLPAANEQVFNPSLRVAADGTVAVTYYDTRFNTTASGLPTDYWAVFANPHNPQNAAGGLANPANWGGEVRITSQSFNLEQASQSSNANSGYYLGDYEGLISVGDRFLAFFPVAGSNGANTSGVVSKWFEPANGDHAGHGCHGGDAAADGRHSDRDDFKGIFERWTNSELENARKKQAACDWLFDSVGQGGARNSK